MDDIVSTIVLPLNMSRMLCGRQIDQSANYFRKKVGAVSVSAGPVSFTAGGPNLSRLVMMIINQRMEISEKPSYLHSVIQGLR